MKAIVETDSGEAAFDFEAFFRIHYERIARVAARVTGDPSRAEELAVEAFWKLWRNPQARGENAGGWLYRTIVNSALNDLRRNARRNRYESLASDSSRPVTPEQARAAAEEREHVRTVITSMEPRPAELLILLSSGLSYAELAAALELNPASVGTLVSRARLAFRKEYVKRYGEPRNERGSLGR